jgi:dihydroflavonol-4-reductase
MADRAAAASQTGVPGVKVCVCGGTGFVGRHLLRALLGQGHEIQALARPSSDLSGLPSTGSAAGDLRWFRGDLTEYPSVEAAAAGCEIVYNLAVPVRTADAHIHHAVNVQGAEHVLRAARATGVRRVVHCSTVGVHGRLRKLPADENHPLAPESPYQMSKAAGERLVLDQVRAHGIPAVIVRLTGIYGPGDMRGLKVFRSVLSGSVTTIGRAEHTVDMAYVSDIVEGLLRCGENDIEPGEAYILGCGTPRPYVDFLRAIASAAGMELRQRRLLLLPFRVAAAVAGPVRRLPSIAPFLRRLDGQADQAFDISKARRDLGYDPTVSFEEGARLTLQWYTENGYLDRKRVAAPETKEVAV